MRGIAVFLVATVLGCGSVTEPQFGSTTAPKLGAEFALRVGESATITDIGLRVKFIGVASDSRCASTVICVWAGDAAVVFEVAPLGGAARRDTLHTTLEPQALAWGRTELRLVQVDPYPTTPGSIPPAQYVVRLTTRPLP
jgi:hypothetical protein